MIESSSANAAFGSPRATPHLPPPLPPQLLSLLLLLLELPQPPPPQLPPPLLLLDELLQLLQPPPDDPPDDDELDEQLLQPPPEEPPDDELDEQPPPPPPLDELDELHVSQFELAHPLELFELAHVESHDSELLQLGPEQLQFGDASQFLSLLHESPQLTFVERGGSLAPASTPGPGNVPDGLP